MSKNTLTLDFNYDFGLISIVSSVKDYRFCWQVNQSLKLNLCRKEDIEIRYPKKQQTAFFNLYEYFDGINLLHYFFVANKAPGSYLIPELKHVDYFLLIQGGMDDMLVHELAGQLKNISFVEALFVTDPNTLSSKHHLIFE